MAKAAKTASEQEHLKKRQNEFTDSMFKPKVTAHLKDGSTVAGRYLGGKAWNNAETAIKSGNWEVYGEGRILTETGETVTVDLMEVEYFS